MLISRLSCLAAELAAARYNAAKRMPLNRILALAATALVAQAAVATGPEIGQAIPAFAQYGIPYPGTYLVDTQGKVVAKYFEQDMRERISASAILAGRLGEPITAAHSSVEAKHVALTTAASTAIAMPGHRILLSVEIDLPNRMHVYAPGVAGYIPAEWNMDLTGGTKAEPVRFPAPEKLYLKPIKETALVYRRKVRLTREITFGQESALKPFISASGELVLKGSFRYQACNDRECYLPETVPIEWRFQFQGMERERAPVELQRKGR